MKIGIITFNSAHNYGAVLQAWALQEKLKNMGHQVEIINYRTPAIDNLYRVYAPKKVCDVKWMNDCVHQLQWLHAWMKDSKRAIKFKKFEHFINKVLPTTKPYRTYQELLEANFDYDVLITGSDQVWNGKFTRGISAAYFLSFGNSEMKRISYAASVGRDCFEEEEKSVVERYLKDFDYISVREEKARMMVQELTDKKVELVLDPTLLLDRKSYDKIKKKSRFKGDYIFVHNVHLTKVDARLNSIVERVSEITGLPVVNNRSDYNFKNELGKFNDGAPGEFIGVIEGAKYVITNSFHATVFSIIYQRNFITVPHFKNPDRMKNLTRIFDIQNHLISSVSEIPDNLDELRIDYDKVERLHKEARSASEKFLENALNGPKTVKKILPKGVHTKQRKYTESLWRGSSYLKDKKILEQCSGGGTSYALAESVWKQGGVVVGTSYDKNQLPYYKIVEKHEDLSDIFKVKYTQADPSPLFEKIQNYLKNGKKVLFMGIPCKVLALYDFLGKDYDNLYTMEEQCRGVITREVYDKYLRSVEKQFSSKIHKIDWDNKTKSANTPFVCIEFENKETFVNSEKSDLLLRAMKRGMVEEQECYSCPHLQNHMSEADFTIYTRMRAEEMNPEGEDYLYVNTDKGMKLFDVAKEQLLINEGVEAIEENPLIMKVERNIFMDGLQKSEDSIALLKKMLAKRVVF